MEVLFIGASNVAKNRVIPALARNPEISRIHIASQRKAPDVSVAEHQRGQFVQGYAEGLAAVEPCVAYVSLPNHLHLEWTLRAIDAGFHVIVDKPAFLSLRDTETVVQRAAAADRCVAEATVWSFHSQIREALNCFAANHSRPAFAQATFVLPGFKPGNFRLVPEFGGGALNDLGPYAASAVRVFFSDAPARVQCHCLSRDAANRIDTGFVFTAAYDDGRVLQGLFSFNSEYRNQVTLLAPDRLVLIEPAFTAPPEGAQQLLVRAANAEQRITVEKGNSFGAFVSDVLESIRSHSWQQWAENMLTDARLLDRAAELAGINRYGN